MITEIWSDRPTFKRLRLHSGLNIVVATRAARVEGQGRDESQRRKSRNGAGKSSVIDVIRFMLGGEVRKDVTVIAAKELKSDNFFMKFDLGGVEVTASRSPSKPGRIAVEGDFADWPVQPDVEKSGATTMTRAAWLDLLGQEMLGLPPQSRIPIGSHLSFLSCIAYFVRRARDGAFEDWRRTFSKQGRADWIAPLSFLFGLDTDVAVKFVRLAEARRNSRDVRRALQDEVVRAVGTKGQVRNALVKAERMARRLEARLESSSVVDFYGDYEKEASELDSRARQLNDENYLDNQYYHDLMEATGEERAPELPDLQRLYSEVGVVLPGVSLRRYDDVKRFHEAVLSNRAAHLQAEIDATRSRIKSRTIEREKVVGRHSEILAILRSGLSRGHYAKLTREFSEAQAEVAHLRRNYELVERIEQSQVDLKAQGLEAERALRADLAEREDKIRESVEIFQEISSYLYDTPAEFDIEASESGPEFAISKPDIGSVGVHNMQVFSFDLTLAVFRARNGKWPGFLVHDSHVFDGVDGRQVGAALAAAHEMLAPFGGQYIVTMNSDDLEKAQHEYGRDFSSSIVQPVLSDAETGGLFGFRFEHWSEADDDTSGSA